MFQNLNQTDTESRIKVNNQHKKHNIQNKSSFSISKYFRFKQRFFVIVKYTIFVGIMDLPNLLRKQ